LKASTRPSIQLPHLFENLYTSARKKTGIYRICKISKPQIDAGGLDLVFFDRCHVVPDLVTLDHLANSLARENSSVHLRAKRG